MKRLLIAAFLLAGMFANLSAEETTANRAGNIGVGGYIGGGFSNGVSAKYWIDQESAVDGVFSIATGDYEYSHLHVDYLMHRFDLANVEEGLIPFYYGLGVYSENDNQIKTTGIRIPVGFSYLLKTAPLDVYMEVAPTIFGGDVSGFYISGGFGFRYYFA